MTACSRVLNCPELLTLIFQAVAEDKFSRRGGHNLVPAACVNKFWFELATDVHWSDSSPLCFCRFKKLPWTSFVVKAIARLEPSRRQMYANKVNNINIALLDSVDDFRDLPYLNDLKFPRLKQATLRNVPALDGTEISLSQYIQPCLQTLLLEIDDEPLPISHFFDKITGDCPRLRSVYLRNFREHIATTELTNFVDHIGNRRLKHLDLSFFNQTDHVFDLDMLAWLSRMDSLESLRLTTSTSGQRQADELLVQSFVPFQNLHVLKISVAPSTICSVASSLSNLTELDITLHEVDAQCLCHLAQLHRLRRLSITFWWATRVAVNELLALRLLGNLEVLSIIHQRCRGLDVTDVPELSDTDFDYLASGFPSIEELCLEIRLGSCSVALLSSLSRHCPLLQRLTTLRNYNAQELSSISAPLFPRLAAWTMGELRWTSDLYLVSSGPEQNLLAKQIHKHAPKLASLIFRCGESRSKALQVWREISQQE